jgi:SAM-dependent methyltransferase
MPTVAENVERWQTHEWSKSGDEWSPGHSAAGTAVLWWRTLMPRIGSRLPTDDVLEIGPGFGRWTQYLRTLCRHLVLVDVTERCIDHCRARFSGDERLEYHVNDGISLGSIPDHSISFAFSFDSLVHAEREVLDRYVAELARVLRPGGSAFIHHSNLARFTNPRTGRVSPFVLATNWRAPSMSAEALREACASNGLFCSSQELINWIGRGRFADRHHLNGKSIPLTDCLSVIEASPVAGRQTIVVNNHRFVDEWRDAIWLARTYGSKEHVEHGHGSRRRLRTAVSILRREGIRAMAALAAMRAAEAGDYARSAIRAHVAGQAVRWSRYPRRLIV